MRLCASLSPAEFVMVGETVTRQPRLSGFEVTDWIIKAEARHTIMAEIKLMPTGTIKRFESNFDYAFEKENKMLRGLVYNPVTGKPEVYFDGYTPEELGIGCCRVDSDTEFIQVTSINDRLSVPGLTTITVSIIIPVWTKEIPA